VRCAAKEAKAGEARGENVDARQASSSACDVDLTISAREETCVFIPR
jgi:hypothetical protein